MRTESFSLTCCKYSDCANPNNFDCTCRQCETVCPTAFRSGGQGFSAWKVDLKKIQVTFKAKYNMYIVPDSYEILYQGSSVFSTGGRKTNKTYGSITSSASFAVVDLNAPQLGTLWYVSFSCPP